MVKHRHADASVCVKPYNLCDKGLTETEYSDSGIVWLTYLISSTCSIVSSRIQ